MRKNNAQEKKLNTRKQILYQTRLINLRQL